MRSYGYEKGEWSLCNDVFPNEEDEPSFLTDELGRLGSRNPRNFFVRLESLGFSRQREDRTCAFGDIDVYIRNHENLNMTREGDRFPYDFLCILGKTPSLIRVWIVDLPDFFMFLREIEAHLTQTEVMNLLKSDEFRELISYAGLAFKDFWLGEGQITVKPPKPPRQKI